MEEIIATKDDQVLTVEMLVKNYSYDVYKMAFFYLKDKGKAEDISQEVFLTCVQKLHTFNGTPSQIKYWLLKITANKCKDVIRSWTYRYESLTDKLVEIFPGKASTQEEILFQKQTQKDLADKILGLPLHYREVIILYYYEEMTVEEITDFLKVNPNTVKTRLKRGREKLKGFLKGE
jgi:RNA polymerase sigma-70 factor, ECF subfamily